MNEKNWYVVHSPCGVAGGNPYGCPEGDPNIQDCPGRFTFVQFEATQ